MTEDRSGRADLRVVKPLGEFRPSGSMDATKAERVGHTFYAANELEGSVPTWEVMFGDGIWILAAPEDLSWT